MKLTKDQIIGALPSLSQRDLLAIKTLAGALLTGRGPDTQNNSENAQGWLFAALGGLVTTAHADINLFNKKAPVFISFVAEHFGSCLNKKVEALAVMTRLLHLIAVDLKEQHVPVTYRTMVNNFPRVRQVFEYAFPGYLASGIGGLVMLSDK